MIDTDHRSQPFSSYKRCPYCYTLLRPDATHCIDCKKKVGKMDKFGLAKKPLNWRAYMAALLWTVMLAMYIWKVFFGIFISE